MLASDLRGEITRSRALPSGFRITTTEYKSESRLQPHTHEFANLTFVLEGAYSERFGSKERYCEPGLFIVHPAGEKHANVHGSAQVRLLNVEVDHARLQQWHEGMPMLREPFNTHATRYYAIACHLEAELRRSDQASDLALESLVIESLVSSSCDRVFAGPAPAGWLNEVVETLRVCPERPHTTAALAKEVGVHPVHVARVFRRRYGCTLGAFLRTVRVEAACKALRTTDLPLAAIAHDAGFADQSHFSRVFSSATGMPPGAYRRSRKVAPVQ